MKSVQILRNKGYSLRAEEEALMTRLASMDRDIAKPSVFRGRLNELWAHLQQLSEVNHEQYFVSDPQGLSTVCQTLEGISKGLGRLTEVVQEDDDTISGLNRGYQESFAKY
jgi:nuclear pore complex protein Nup54